MAFWWKPILVASSRSRTTTAPPTTSEWPPTYLVVEWTTTSAPSASGCWRYGDANVLSTTSRAPTSFVTDATAAVSAIPSNGLVGVSHQTTRVVGRSAARRASTSPRSTGVYSTPHGASTLSTSRNVPP